MRLSVEYCKTHMTSTHLDCVKGLATMLLYGALLASHGTRETIATSDVGGSNMTRATQNFFFAIQRLVASFECKKLVQKGVTGREPFSKSVLSRMHRTGKYIAIK